MSYAPPAGPVPMWLCGDGKTRVRLSEMDEGHLINVERFLLGRGATDAELRRKLFEWWYSTIRDEIDRRGLTDRLWETHPAALDRQEQAHNVCSPLED